MRMELLSPAGNVEKLYYAYAYGADAAYIGLKKFSLRVKADNFYEDEYKKVQALKEAFPGRRLHCALNISFHDEEIDALKANLDYFRQYPIDAFIVQDIGIVPLLQKEFPKAQLHLSTQASCVNSEAVKMYRSLGFSRIVLGREISINQIRRIKDAVPDMELETFVHGAMCYSYSGQCLMSSLAGVRSGNRGRCAQPCRKCYDGDYILSMKDMCALELIPELAKAGIDSFKIEGRMKNEYYVASAVDAYKEMTLDYLNGCFSEKKAQKYKFRLANIYNRGGFCDGYFKTSFNCSVVLTPILILGSSAETAFELFNFL